MEGGRGLTWREGGGITWWERRWRTNGGREAGELTCVWMFGRSRVCSDKVFLECVFSCGSAGYHGVPTCSRTPDKHIRSK